MASEAEIRFTTFVPLGFSSRTKTGGETGVKRGRGGGNPEQMRGGRRVISELNSPDFCYFYGRMQSTVIRRGMQLLGQMTSKPMLLRYSKVGS